jgi:mRNA-degrading endonuclease RelE of RelBE toxin-antitoxin system
VTVVLADAALDDLRRLGPPVARRVLEQVTVLESSPDAGAPLVSGSGFRKLVGRGGTWRVVYAVDADTVTVWQVWVDGVRSNGAAYAEALHRMQAADTPEAVEHARLLERLGRITGTVPVARHRVREPVPDWLADALVERAGLTRLEVTAMDASTAFDRWNAAT